MQPWDHTVEIKLKGNFRLTVDKTAKRVRQLLASTLWDSKVTQWLHGVLCDSLPREYLGAYFDVLQTLKAKIPALVDKMVAGRVCHDSFGHITREGLRVLLKRKWDPAASALADKTVVSGDATRSLTASRDSHVSPYVETPGQQPCVPAESERPQRHVAVVHLPHQELGVHVLPVGHARHRVDAGPRHSGGTDHRGSACHARRKL